MCSSPEADDRANCMEISAFESTSTTFNLPPKSRVPCPHRCVKKYRRSAAGGGVKAYKNERTRTVQELYDTVGWLLGKVYNERERFNNSNLSYAVSFISDRLRAIQVDFVTGRLLSLRDDKIPSMLHRMCSFYILNSYVLSSLPPPHFERRFNMQALHSCLQMLKTYRASNPTEEPSRMDDEHLAYTVLLHVSSHINGEPGGGIDVGQGLNPICTICPEDYETGRYPRLGFALGVARMVEVGDYMGVLKAIECKEGDERWRYLARFCMADCVGRVRLELVKRMNKAWGKGEKVKVEEVARLLHMKTRVKECEAFCVSHGLPVSDGMVTFKVNPVDEGGGGEGGRGNREEDEMVFGRGVKEAVLEEMDKQGVRGIREPFARWILDVR